MHHLFFVVVVVVVAVPLDESSAFVLLFLLLLCSLDRVVDVDVEPPSVKSFFFVREPQVTNGRESSANTNEHKRRESGTPLK